MSSDTGVIAENESSVALQSRKWAGRIIAAILLLGMIARLLRMLSDFPLWNDEAAVALNVYSRDWSRLFLQLDMEQVAPKLFLAVEKLAMTYLGEGEISLRLFPLLAGISALLLFARFCRDVLPRRTAILTVAFAAFSVAPIDLSNQLKPYSLDLLAAVAILLYSERALLSVNPWRSAWPLLFIVLIATGFSFASVLMIGAAAAYGCLLAIARRGRFSAALQGSFWLAVGVIGTGSYFLFFAAARLDPQMDAFMQNFWAQAFPPSAPIPFLRWIVVVHIGEMFGYPAGGILSIPIFLLFLLGAFQLFRTRPVFAGLLLSPFVTTFIASAMHRYPYGWKVRVSQHLAPSIWIFGAVGIAWLISLVGQSAAARKLQRRLSELFILFLLSVGAWVVGSGFTTPYRRLDDAQARQIGTDFLAASSAGKMVLLSPLDDLPRPFRWYTRKIPMESLDAITSPDRHPRLIVAVGPKDLERFTTIISSFGGKSIKELSMPGRNAGTMLHIAIAN